MRHRPSRVANAAFYGSVKCGIGHTRWATHGRPSEGNSHPHRDCTGRFFVAHNGIIENYLQLKRRLIADGHKFASATDTEVLPHLIESYYDGELAVVGSDSVQFTDVDGRCTCRPPETITWTAEMAEKEGYAYFMQKEIYEQPRAIRDTLIGRLGANNTVTLDADLGDMEALSSVDRLHIVAMGTSLHAGLVGKFLIESLARI